MILPICIACFLEHLALDVTRLDYLGFLGLGCGRWAVRTHSYYNFTHKFLMMLSGVICRLAIEAGVCLVEVTPWANSQVTIIDEMSQHKFWH